MTLFRGLIDLSVHRCYKLDGKTRTLIESIEKIFFSVLRDVIWLIYAIIELG